MPIFKAKLDKNLIKSCLVMQLRTVANGLSALMHIVKNCFAPHRSHTESPSNHPPWFSLQIAQMQEGNAAVAEEGD